MKLRIRGDSVRLRLTKAEVKRIGEGLAVRESTHFLHDSCLQYILEPSNIPSIEAQFIDHVILVKIPKETAIRWVHSQEVAVKHEILNKSGTKLFILIEKDFACLKPRANEAEDESDMFENPNTAAGACSPVTCD